MLQSSNFLNFLNFQASKSLKSCLVFSRNKEILLYSKSDICNIIQKECHLQHFLQKIIFYLYLDPKIFDNGGSGASVLVSILLLSHAMLKCNIFVIAIA